jgi:membrane protease YdiL (CAAX protease family)
MRDGVGLSVLAILLAASIRVLAGADEWAVPSFVAFVVAAPTAWYLWRDPRSPEKPLEWLLTAIGTVFFGALFLAIDVSWGQSQDPSASMWQAAQSAGSPFGFLLTLSVCPGFTCICVAGAAREAFKRATPIE